MLIGPSRISTALVNNSESSVRAYKVPRIYRVAFVVGIADQPCRIDRSDSSISGRSTGRTSVQQRLIEIYTFLVLSRGSVGPARSTGSSREPITCRFLRRSKDRSYATS
jgi:hypothetical protein